MRIAVFSFHTSICVLSCLTPQLSSAHHFFICVIFSILHTGFLIGFICAGTVAIAYLLTKTVRNRRKGADEGEEFMLEHQESKDIEPCAIPPSPATPNTGGVTFVPVDADYYNYDDGYNTRIGAAPRSYDNLGAAFSDDQANANQLARSGPSKAKKPHFCNSQLCEICCGTVATPHLDGGLCCDLPSIPCPYTRNDTLQPRAYCTPDTIEF